MMDITWFALLAVGVIMTPNLNVDDYKGVIRLYCKHNATGDEVDQVLNAGIEFADCFKNFVNVSQLLVEVNHDRSRGALYEVFKKYCVKSSQLKTCIHTLLDKVSPCLEAKIGEHIPAARNISIQLIDLLCFEDGDRLAAFIAVDGSECLRRKADEIRECVTMLKLDDMEAAKNLSRTEECTKADELAACVVGKMEGCPTPTTAMVEALLKLIREQSSCHTLIKGLM